MLVVEVLDYGYPQNCAIDLMKVLIRLGKANDEVQEDASSITSQVTGAIDWYVSHDWIVIESSSNRHRIVD